MDREKKSLAGMAAIVLTVLSALLAPMAARADRYRVVALSGVELSLGGKKVGVGAEFDDSRQPQPRWLNAPKGYVKLRNLTSGADATIVPPKKKGEGEGGFWSRVKGYFSDIRKCSTRGVAAGSGDGVEDLAEKLSMTFYLIDEPAENVRIASELPLDEHRRIEIEMADTPRGNGKRRPLTALDGSILLTPEDIRSLGGERGEAVRLAVFYVDDVSGIRRAVCDGMLAVILEP